MSAYETWKAAYPLHALVQVGNLTEIQEAPDTFTPLVNKIDNEKWYPIHYCCFEGHPQVLDWLLKSGATVDVGNHFGSTPLHLTIGTGNLSCLVILLKSIKTKEQLLQRNQDKQTPRDMLGLAEVNVEDMKKLFDDKLAELA